MIRVSFTVDMPEIRTEAEALPSSVPILGRSRSVESRVTVGISDVCVPRPSSGGPPPT